MDSPFTQSLRADGNRVPVLMLSALADASDRIAGLETGSDDYLPKPFEPRELAAADQGPAQAAGGTGAKRGEVLFGRVRVQPAPGRIAKRPELIRLTTPREGFPACAGRGPETPVPRNELAPEGSEEGARSVDVQINRLRQKIEDDPSNPVYLQTVRGAGYVLHVD
jgi:two-component system, OmpR family, phosphate regulon response regulator OmpR